MTWIKTVSVDESDEVRKAVEAQRELYPIEYATPVHPTPDGETAGIVASHSLIPNALFHAFATTKKKGIGLGLYTCREVVRAHGGTIEVDSKQGVGTTFRVVLPSPQAKKSFSKAERKFISSQI